MVYVYQLYDLSIEWIDDNGHRWKGEVEWIVFDRLYIVLVYYINTTSTIYFKRWDPLYLKAGNNTYAVCI